jgi:hypothetical protein
VLVPAEYRSTEQFSILTEISLLSYKENKRGAVVPSHILAVTLAKSISVILGADKQTKIIVPPCPQRENNDKANADLLDSHPGLVQIIISK